MTYAMAYLLIILLLPLLGLNVAGEFCPTGCRCTFKVLNCSRLANSPGLLRVPLPKRGHYPFKYLDFSGNAISFVGKKVWKAYPRAKYLNLSSNRLTSLKTSSLEGLTSLVYLDLSNNNIRSIEEKTFEAVPLLQFADLSHNPLAVSQDAGLYKLPMLKFRDLGATKMEPNILGDPLETSLPLKTLPQGQTHPSLGQRSHHPQQLLTTSASRSKHPPFRKKAFYNFGAGTTSALKKPSDMVRPSETGGPDYGYKKKMLLICAVTSITVFLFVTFVLLEDYSQYSEEKSFLGKENNPRSDEEGPDTAGEHGEAMAPKGVTFPDRWKNFFLDKEISRCLTEKDYKVVTLYSDEDTDSDSP